MTDIVDWLVKMTSNSLLALSMLESPWRYSYQYYLGCTSQMYLHETLVQK